MPEFTSMDLPDINAHSFVIKIWMEETREEAGEFIWRGRIIHIPSNQQFYFTTLKQIPDFIQPYISAWTNRRTISR